MQKTKASQKMQRFLLEVSSAPGEQFPEFSAALISTALKSHLVRTDAEQYRNRRLRDCSLWITEKGQAIMQEDGLPITRLSPKQKYCLTKLYKRDMCSFEISLQASSDGINKNRCLREWANDPLRSLRKMGLAERTNVPGASGRKKHTLTVAGRLLAYKTDRVLPQKIGV